MPEQISNLDDLRTTRTRVRRMRESEAHLTWFRIAYADLTHRLALLSADIAALRAEVEEIKPLLQHEGKGEDPGREDGRIGQE